MEDNKKDYWDGSCDFAYNLLVDKKRVWTYRQAIRNSVKKGDIVADLGTGTGIMAFFAAEQGAKKVYAVEVDSNLHKNLEITIQMNKYKNIINLVKDDVFRLKLPEKVDVVICEMVAPGLIYEKQVEVMNYIQQFLKETSKIIPSKINNYIDLVYKNDSFYGYKMHIVRVDYYNELESKAFSDKVLYSAVDFKTINDIVVDKKISLTVTKNGIINGLRMSSEIFFPDGSTNNVAPVFCNQWVLPIKDQKVNKGETYSLHLFYKMGGGTRSLDYSLIQI